MSLLKRLLGQGGINGGHLRASHGGGHHGNRYNQHGEPGPQCLECRAVNKSGARYCHRCGQPFAAASATCGQCAAPLP
ncbi:zinc ribbon domain-containing protein, partial [Serratia marcescens]